MKTSAEDPTAGLTPAMRQFQAIKQQHPDKILMFRMGDFYEMFGDDAVKAAPILGIALTSRGHVNGQKIPLAGIPYHALERYLSRLTSKGEKVVIVEQVEDPKLAKGVVKREIVEIVTPGTVTIESPEEASRLVALAAVFPKQDKKMGIALLGLSTGMFVVDEGEFGVMIERVRVFEPSEILFPAEYGKEKMAELLGYYRGAIQLTPFEDWNFDLATARRDLNEQFGTATLESFGLGDEHLAITAAGAILRYLKENHRNHLQHLTRLTRYDSADFMSLDYSTVRNLELVANSALNTEENSLFSVINHCHTGAGSRRLKGNLLRPFRSKEVIDRRLDAIDELLRNRDLLHQIRQETSGLPDLEKLAGRLGIAKLNPRQMSSIAVALRSAVRLKHLLESAESDHFREIRRLIPDGTAIINRIESALVDEPPLSTVKGGFLRVGYSERLDSLNESIKDARTYIGSLQAKEKERTGISTLKVGFNQVFGYYIEISKAQSTSVPQEYIRKQTLVNAERYITPELKEKEELILAAEEKIVKLECELYDEIIAFLSSSIAELGRTAELLAEIDVVAGLAELAQLSGYCRPEIHTDGRLLLTGGRHPVIESVLPKGSFVANDVAFETNGDRIHILTGPNMSGKSTYLRQIGLIVIMAQIGSFVPADHAEIGLVDRVFTRVGALDNLARGQSTFLVEMVETANIVHNATEFSLVLLDEVGRGTSTFDGLSVAWSVVEYINDNKRPRTVFATHYHELTGMASLYPSVKNYQVAVKKWQDQVVFLHKIIPGGCDDSYGIEVARLAGVPRTIITRARQILKLLESGKFSQSELGKGIYKEKVQSNLFDAGPNETELKIKGIDLDTMSPVQAFDFLRQVKEDLDS
ncbi:MAG: DNA mismatch repair protein MutS [Candidatus Zixiibacteriota bacterium]